MKHSKEILTVLAHTYQDMGSALHFDNVFQLLIAVILSAQTNDNQVNKITEKLFVKCPTAVDFVQLNQEQLEQYIKTCGLYKNKAKNILATCHILVEQYQGQVPQEQELLMQLPGVGRKTANVVRSVGFGIPALAVDTHVFRVSKRLGLAEGNTPEAVEKELCQLIPRQQWGQAHHWLIWHGRKVCAAQNPHCDICPCLQYCPQKIVLKNKAEQ